MSLLNMMLQEEALEEIRDLQGEPENRCVFPGFGSCINDDCLKCDRFPDELKP